MAVRFQENKYILEGRVNQVIKKKGHYALL